MCFLVSFFLFFLLFIFICFSVTPLRVFGYLLVCVYGYGRRELEILFDKT